MINGLIYLSAFLSLFFYDPVVIADHHAGMARPIVKAAHQYHGLDAHNNGVQYSIEDATGLYFYRGGKRCRLFTKGFLSRWERD